MPPTSQISIDFSNIDDATLSQMLKDYGLDPGPINNATRRTYERRLLKLKTGAVLPSRYQEVDDDDIEEDVQVKLPETRRRPQPFSPEPPRPYMPEIKQSYTSEVRQPYTSEVKQPYTSEVRQPYTSEVRQPYTSEVRQPYTSEVRQPYVSEVRRHEVTGARDTLFSSRMEYSPRIESRPNLPSVRKTASSYSTPDSSRTSLRKQPEAKGRSFPLWVKLVVPAVVVILLYLIYINMEPQAVSNIPGIQNKIEV